MKKIKLLIFMVLFVVFSFSVASYSLLSYPRIGGYFGDFSYIVPQEQLTLFNDNFLPSDSTAYVRSLSSNLSQNPIYFDLDNDTINELLVSSTSSLRIYKGSSLSLNYTISTDSAIKHYAVYVFGGETYIVVEGVLSGFTNIKIYKWLTNDTAELFFSKKSSTALGTGAYSGASNFACALSGNCVELFFSGTGHMYANTFALGDNNISFGNMPMSVGITPGGNACYSSSPFYVSVSEAYDNDYFFAPFFTPDQKLYMVTAIVNRTTDVFYDLGSNVIITSGVSVVGGGSLGFYNGDSLVTYAGSYITTTNRVRMYSVTHTLASGWVLYDTHTGFADPVVYAISNTFTCKVFTNDYEANYCVFGFSATNDSFLMASTDWGVGWLETDTVTAIASNFSSSFLLSSAYDSFQRLSHSINANNNMQDGSYISDFVTPYGIYSLNAPNYFTGSASLNLSYSFPYQNAVVIPSNIKNSPYYDFIFLTANNLISLVDNFIITPPQIDAYTVNPCVNAVWLQNTSVQVSFNPVSFNDLYDVSGRAILYYGDTNVQNGGWSAFVDSHSRPFFVFDFVANKTIQNGILRLEAIDSNNVSTAVLSIPFSVAVNGVSFGECQTTATGLIVASAVTPEVVVTYEGVPLSNTNNAIANSFQALAHDMNMPAMLLFLILMFGMNVVVFLVVVIEVKQIAPVFVFSGLIIFDIIAIIIATLLGVISSWLIITLVVILVIIGAIMLSGVWNKHTSGGAGSGA